MLCSFFTSSKGYKIIIFFQTITQILRIYLKYLKEILNSSTLIMNINRIWLVVLCLLALGRVLNATPENSAWKGFELLACTLFPLYIYKRSNRPQPVQVAPPIISRRIETEMPVKKLGFDNMENSSEYENKSYIDKMFEESSPEPPVKHLTLHKSRNPSTSISITKTPTKAIGLKKSAITKKNLMVDLLKNQEEYDDAFEKLRENFEKVLKESNISSSKPQIFPVKEPEIPSSSLPGDKSVSKLKPYNTPLPVIPESSEIDPKFEFNPIKHTSTSSVPENSQAFKPSTFNPLPLGTKPLALSGLEVNLNQLGRPPTDLSSIPPHLILPVYKPDSSTRQESLLVGPTFTPMPHHQEIVSGNPPTNLSSAGNSNPFRGNIASNLRGSTLQNTEASSRTAGINSDRPGNSVGFKVNGESDANMHIEPASISSGFFVNSSNQPKDVFKPDTSNFGGAGMSTPKVSNPFNQGQPLPREIASNFTNDAPNMFRMSNLTTGASAAIPGPSVFQANAKDPFTKDGNTFSSQPTYNASNPEFKNQFFVNPNNFPERGTSGSIGHQYISTPSHVPGPLASQTFGNYPTTTNLFPNTGIGMSHLQRNPDPFGQTSNLNLNLNQNTNLNPFQQANPQPLESKTVPNPFSISNPGASMGPFNREPAFQNTSSMPSSFNPVRNDSMVVDARPSSFNNTSLGRTYPQGSVQTFTNNPPKLDDYLVLRRTLENPDASFKIYLEEIVFLVNCIGSNMQSEEHLKFSCSFTQIFKKVDQRYSNIIKVCFGYQLLDYYTQIEDDPQTFIRISQNIVQIIGLLCKEFPELLDYITTELACRSDIFADKMYGSDEALKSLQFVDLERLYKGGELQKQANLELIKVTKLGVLFGSLFVGFKIVSSIWDFLQKLSHLCINRYWIPALLGVLISGKDALSVTYQQEYSRLIELLVNKMNLIEGKCNRLYYQVYITQIEVLLGIKTL